MSALRDAPNPYENHAGLTPLEADVLWEYSKLGAHIKDVRLRPPDPPRGD